MTLSKKEKFNKNTWIAAQHIAVGLIASYYIFKVGLYETTNTFKYWGPPSLTEYILLNILQLGCLGLVWGVLYAFGMARWYE